MGSSSYIIYLPKQLVKHRSDGINIIYKNRTRYVPTHLALQEGIAMDAGRFGNEHVLTINYHYDEQKIMDHYRDNIGLEIDSTLPF